MDIKKGCKINGRSNFDNKKQDQVHSEGIEKFKNE